MAKLGESVYRPPNSGDARNCRCMRNSPGVIESAVDGTGGRTTAFGVAAYTKPEATRAMARAILAEKLFK